MTSIERNRRVTMVVAALLALLAGALLPLARAVHAAPAATTIPHGLWISNAELAQLPMSGSAWSALKATADGSLGTPNISDQGSNHDVNTLAVALVYARTLNTAYRTKAAGAIMSAVGTEAGGRTLALGRNLLSYVIAADLIDLRGYDASMDSRFRSWLSAVRRETLDSKTLISTHEQRPNNWGTHAGASRIAADLSWATRPTSIAPPPCSRAGWVTVVPTPASNTATSPGKPTRASQWA